jgi:hypothetical protein
VLFNRFYEPDIDIENLEVQPSLILSHHSDMLLPLNWIALLHDRIPASLAATTGISKAEDVIKMLMAGADVTMLVATLLRHGIGHIQTIEEELITWLQEHEYESLDILRGSMSQRNSPNPSEFERVQYMVAWWKVVPIKLVTLQTAAVRLAPWRTASWRLAMAKVASRRSARLSTVPFNTALLRSVVYNSAPRKSAPDKLASRNSAMQASVWFMLAWRKSAWSKLASRRRVRVRSALVSTAALRVAPAKSASWSRASRKSAPVRVAACNLA